MANLSFKTDESFKEMLTLLAKKKGINVSAYIKLVLNKGLNEELSELTENGLTVAEELEILKSADQDEVFGPFKSSTSLMKALKA